MEIICHNKMQKHEMQYTNAMQEMSHSKKKNLYLYAA